MKKIIIGMIHLPPLPGYRKHPGMDEVIKHALNSLQILQIGGVGAVLVENEYDHPHQVKAGPEIIAAMSRVVSAVVEKSKIPVGVEVLLNDPKASLAIAKICGAKFIRSDYFVDKMWRKEYGEMEINPKKLISFKNKIKANDVKIFADVQVKYAKLLEKGKTVKQSVNQAVKSGADGIIVTGKITGQAPDLADLHEAKLSAGKIPVYVGSGFSAGNAGQLLKFCNGAIVGTSIKKNGIANLGKIKELIQVVKKYD